MSMQTVSTTDDAATTVINFHDWDGTHSIPLEVARDASVAEIVEEARVELDLPANVSYLALHRERQLDDGATVRDAGIDTDADIELVPNVKAG